MFAVLCPAKTFDPTPPPPGLPCTAPALQDEAALLLAACRALSPDQIARLMKVQEDLALANHARFQRMTLPILSRDSGPLSQDSGPLPQDTGAAPAALAFAGDVYKGLDARSLTAADLEWAQTRIGILSGLFGLLRPLDLIQPHRLEMGTPLPTPRGRGLYAFWGDRIARLLREQLAGHRDPCLIDLASIENLKAVPRSALRAPVLTPVFEQMQGTTAKSVVVHAKIARGQMARFIIEARVETSEQLKDFRADRYRFEPRHSTRERLVFRRPFVPVTGRG